MYITCKTCLWFADCQKMGYDRDWDEVCKFYDGLLVLDEQDSSPDPEKNDYDESELGYDDYEVYIEGLGFVKCDPMTLVIK